MANITYESNETNIILLGIGLSVLAWPIPTGSALVVNIIERYIIKKLLEINKCDTAVTGKIFWKFHRKHLLVFICTYLPIIGIPFQIYEVWTHQKFTIACCRMGITKANRKAVFASFFRGKKQKQSQVEPVPV